MNRFKIFIILFFLSFSIFGCSFNTIDKNSKLKLQMPENGTIRTAGGQDIYKPTSYIVKITSKDGGFLYEKDHPAGAEVCVSELNPDLYLVEVMGICDSYVFKGACKVEVAAGSTVGADIQLQAYDRFVPVRFSLDSSIFDTLHLERFYYTVTDKNDFIYEGLENIKMDSLSKDNPTFDITTIKGGHKYNITLYGENDKFVYKIEKNSVYLANDSFIYSVDSSSMKKVSSYIQLETDYTLTDDLVSNPLTVILKDSGSNVVASENITQLPYIFNYLKADTYTIDISSSSSTESYGVKGEKVVSFDDLYDGVTKIIPEPKSLYFVRAGASSVGATGVENAPFGTLTAAVNQAENLNNENNYNIKVEGNVTGEQLITTSTGKFLNLIRKDPSVSAGIQASASLFNIDGGIVVSDGINLSGNSSTAVVTINNSGTFKIKGDCTVTNGDDSGNSVVVISGLLQLDNCNALAQPVYLKGNDCKISVLSSLTPSTVATIKLDNYDRTESVLMGSNLSTLKTKFKMADNNYEIDDSGKSVRKTENVTFNVENFSSYQGTNQLTYTISEGNAVVPGHENKTVPDNGSIVVNGKLKAGIEYTVTVTGSKGDYNFQTDTSGNKFTIAPDGTNSFTLPVKTTRKIENAIFNIKNFSSYQGTNQLTYTISEGDAVVSGHENQPIPDNGSIVVNSLLKAGIEYTVTVTGIKGDYKFKTDTAGNKFKIEPDKTNTFTVPIKPINGSLKINSSSVTLSENTFTVEISGGGLSSARTETVTSFPHLVKDLPCDPKTTFNITVNGTTAEETYSSPSTAEVTAGKSVNYNIDAAPAPGFYYVDANSNNGTSVGTKAAPFKALSSTVNVINGLADSSPQYTIIIVSFNGSNDFTVSNNKKIEIKPAGLESMGNTLTITVDPGAHLTLNRIKYYRNGNGYAPFAVNGTVTLIDSYVHNANVDVAANQKLRIKGSTKINNRVWLKSGATIEIIGDLSEAQACTIDVEDKPGVGANRLVLTGSGSLVQNNYGKIGLSSGAGYTLKSDGNLTQ